MFTNLDSFSFNLKSLLSRSDMTPMAIIVSTLVRDVQSRHNAMPEMNRL